MKSSLIVQLFLWGAATVSASPVHNSIYKKPLYKRLKLVDLAQFGEGFHTITLEEAKANAAKNNAEHAGLLSGITGSNSKAANTVVHNTAASTDSGNNATAVKAAAAGNCTSPATRVEWRSLSDADKLAFVGAIKCLMNLPPSGAYSSAGSTSRYEDLVAVHSIMTDSIHMVAQFLPWHRYYVHVFESMLRDECSYAGPMTWWNEPLDAGHFSTSPVFGADTFGSAPLKTSDNQGTCIDDGAFSNLTLHIGGERCLSRAVDETATTQCSTDFVNSCNSNNKYSDMESCSEFGPHGYGHNGIGAVMSFVSISPGDPVFFMHHGFVDHSYVLWQNADLTNRLNQVNGCTDSACSSQLTADYVLSSQGLRPEVKVSDVLDTQGGYLCYVYDS
ncbi:hypothetical protein PFICI_03069 [Pestalotiopsis fici W106-1]|uniref:Tyrosinase copper-binding domain-containing protein n=1 Tax=Pestalotiopsis fici (strain W106-1 / CGMCC3.15140) TaxID=1229662 RepID=W3XGA5_PESFW|nr:uncharacterized protein PFICI_03069 [Pestalotiopsis fici W106-1]ETS85044.1 hypothetical protein PFICI_03069 [Pestalotiopsis fici W106-1]